MRFCARYKAWSPSIEELLQCNFYYISKNFKETFAKTPFLKARSVPIFRSKKWERILNLKIPRVRIGHSFRPAILPDRWKRIDKDYEEVRKHIYSTNPVESINAGLERMAIELGNYFPSERALEVNLFVQMANLQDKWWQKPMPTVQAVSYEIQQKFVLTYEFEAVL